MLRQDLFWPILFSANKDLYHLNVKISVAKMVYRKMSLTTYFVLLQVPPTLPGGVIPPSSIAGTHPGAPNISVPQNVTSQPEPSPPPPPMPAINQKTVAQRQESYGWYFLITNK